VDQQLKQLMKELGEAINESLADSEQIAEVVSKIKDGGYDIFLVLEATIGVSKPGEKSSDKTSLNSRSASRTSSFLSLCVSRSRTTPRKKAVVGRSSLAVR